MRASGDAGHGASATDPDTELSLYQLLNPDVLANPYPLYRRIRETEAVHWDIFMQCWVVTRYDDVIQVLRTFSAARTPSAQQLVEMGLPEMGIIAELTGNQMLFSDPPRHTRLRSLTALAFTPRSVAALRERIESTAAELLAVKLAQGELDVMGDFAATLPAILTAVMLGVPETDHAKLRKWGSDFSETFGNFHYDPVRTPEIVGSCRDMSEYFRDCVRRQKVSPTEGVVQSLMSANLEGETLTEEEVIANCIVIMVGGLETTSSLIANGMLILLEHPAQLDIIRHDLTLLPSVVEELLRFDSPVQHTGRVAPSDVTMSGKEIRAGRPVIAVLAAANRDPDRFPDPDCFDLSRADNKHVAFGWASHFCLGAALARLEARIALAALLRLPNLRLKPGLLKWRTHLGLRSVTSLPVLFDVS